MVPRYSIIVPVYNVRAWIRECLDSVLRQTVADWECICVDDGSTDGSSEILDEYARCDTRFKVMHKSNGGVSSARNMALDNACGDWIVYLDGDDILTDVCLASFDKCLSFCPEADMLQMRIADMPEQTRGCSFNVDDLNDRMPVVFKDRMDIVGGILDVSFVTYAYKRDVCGAIRFPNYTFGEDRLYLAACLVRCALKVKIDIVGYGCRTRKGSAMRSCMTLRKFSDNVRSKRDIMEILLSAKSPRLVSRHIKRMIATILLEHTLHEVDRLPVTDLAEGWRVWFSSVDSIPSCAIATNWQRMVCAVIKATHSRCLARMFCIWPHRLKLKKAEWLRKIS